ncbi:biliverdin-producing heme oxygenase [Archangium lansingense]|uniref:Biliverdin-producing heme oxygenase n=1 Tax=Archangium lansingense TaxID=2995310 RepID=A0ABT3ZZD9_9BACT|nr:biliverdin-producing heme oxygenase [Archangium lansinium]MCY1074436.1 biliverdin-producing heme oxygenase [Archangium lansinium]
MLQTLKAETRPHHERAERVVRLLSPDLTLSGYRRHLEALYGLYAPLEAALASCLEGLFPALRLADRWKLPLLEADLRALGHDDASLARLPVYSCPPALPGVPEALGTLYVLEGATLGGQLILRHLTRHFERGAAGGFSFFRAYGESVGPMWRAFGEALLCACPDPVLTPRVVRGAQDTFEAFEAWLREVHADAPSSL